MNVADMHCDTIYMLLHQKRKGEETSLFQNTLHIDLQKMKQSDYLLQNFALFVGQNECNDVYEEAKAEYAVFLEEMEKNKDHISQVFSYEDIETCRKEGKIAAMLTLEEGEIFQGSLEKLKEFYDHGVRMATLVWNFDNSLSTSASHYRLPKKRAYDGSRPGLTEKGIEFVQFMEELGMIPDISHMSDAGIEDLFQVAKKPFVASHSNARTLCSHQRNLKDPFLKKLGERGCLIGANFYSAFLKDQADFTKTAWIADHIIYMVDQAGLESVGLGSDFDGIECDLEMKDCSGMYLLAEELKKRGMSEDAIDRIFYKNVLHFYKEVL